MKLIYAACLFLLISCQAWAAPPLPTDNIEEFIAQPASRAIIRQLRAGGYVLYMRHGKTDTSRPDRVPKIDLNDCSSQRPLTEAGRLEAGKIGRYIRAAKIPIGEVYSSPLCRAHETARAAFNKEIIIEPFLMYTAYMLDSEKGPTLEKTRELLSRPVDGPTNRVVVAHAQNLMEIMNYLPQPEGIVVIFKPMGENLYKYIASVNPDQWKYLTWQAAE